MSTDSTVWTRTGRLSPAAFTVGGTAILLDAIVQGTVSVSSFTVPDWVNTVLGLGGLWVATFGLVGAFALFVDRDLRLAQAGAVAGTVAWVLFTVTFGWALVLALTGGGGDDGSGTTMLVVPALVLTLLSFLCYGVATVRSGHPSRTVGYLFLLPFLVFLVLLLIFFGTNAADVDFPVIAGVVLFGLVAVSIVALGATLSRDLGPPLPD